MVLQQLLGRQIVLLTARQPLMEDVQQLELLQVFPVNLATPVLLHTRVLDVQLVELPVLRAARVGSSNKIFRITSHSVLNLISINFIAILLNVLYLFLIYLDK
jgi:hypothetical protein